MTMDLCTHWLGRFFGVLWLAQRMVGGLLALLIWIQLFNQSSLLAFLVASLLGFYWPYEQLTGEAQTSFTWKFFKLGIVHKLVPFMYYILALEKSPYFSKIHFLQV